MKYLAVIEIPKGSDRRIHKSFDGFNFIDLGPIKEQIPVNDGIMPVHYGYLENTINPIEKDEVDVIVFSNDQYKTGDKTEVKIIGMLTREDGDHKIIASDTSTTPGNFSEIPEQERNLILEYFGYKSKIISIDDDATTFAYLNDCLVHI
jgi:inorganic pyrophosphatase